MDEQLKILSEKVELLSKNIDTYKDEIALLKAEIKRLSGEENIASTRPVITKPTTAASPGFENFVGLKLIHFVGIIVLLIGLSTGVKYAIDAKLISPLLRIILAYAAGFVLFIISLRLKEKFFLFSVILFSGAMASAYFTTYAAYEYYSFFPRSIAFGLMLLFTIFTVFNSLKYNRQEIALLGLAGAYAIPFFVGDNSGNVLVLFSYLLLINGGILFISFKKYWLPLTYTSFFVSWLIFIAATLFHASEESNSVFYTFAFVFFFLFLINCLVFKILKQLPVNASDTFILIADSLFLYSTLCYLSDDLSAQAVSYITIIFSAVYLMGALLAKSLQPMQVHLANSLFAMSFIAAVLFVALKFSGFTVTIIWVLMAVAVFVIGMVVKIKTLRLASIALFAVTLIKLLLIDSSSFSDIEKIIGWVFTGVVLLAVSFLYQKFKQQIFNSPDK